jgi:phage host-nuclease inhibitor protein Gam
MATTKKRTRVQTRIIADLSAVDAALAEVAEIDRQVTEAEAEMNRRIDAIKAEYAPKTEALGEQRDQLAEALAWMASLTWVRDDDEDNPEPGQLCVVDVGCGCCSHRAPAPDQLADVIRAAFNAGDSGDN